MQTPTSTSYDGESYVNIYASTLTNNTATVSGGAIYCYTAHYSSLVAFPKKAYVDIENSTICFNESSLGSNIYNRVNSGSSFLSKVYTKSSIILANSDTSIFNYDATTGIVSFGYNIFSEATLTGSNSNDSLSVDSLDLNLGPLADYGGSTWTMMPFLGSPAINQGTPSDLTTAQNWVISDGQRDIGAAENDCIVYLSDTVFACDSAVSESGLYTWTTSGIYNDTLFDALGCDTLIYTFLTIGNSFQTETINLCIGDSYTFPDGTVESNLMLNMSYLSNLLSSQGCDSVILTNVFVTPIYNDTIQDTICSGDSYTFPDGTTQSTILSNVIFQSNLVTLFGCDSIIVTNLFVNPAYSSVVQDTICQGESYLFPDGSLQTNIMTGLSYTSALQTIAGCDSIIVTELFVKSIDLSVTLSGFTITALQSGASYQWLDCTNGNASIPGETGQSFTPLSNGSFAAELTWNGCTDTSACIAVSVIGLTENEKQKLLRIFPNPTDGVINLNFGSADSVSVRVYTINNQLVYEQTNISGSDFRFEFNADSGVYILELTLDGRIEMYKIVKQ